MKRRGFIASAAALLAVSAAGSAEALSQGPIVLPKAPIEGLTIAPEFYPSVIAVKRTFPAGSIIVVSAEHFLYYIVRPGRAIRYGVAVGRSGLTFKGQAVVGELREWPSWKPTPEMIARSPGKYAKYADGLPGGPKNPLGARAIYLHQNGWDTGIRIHGTIEPNSIGTSVSNGCLRMVNEHVIDLYARVQLGAPVTVY
ncbi:MAG: L,D-transpeptidase [Paracoccaceae bacterium]